MEGLISTCSCTPNCNYIFSCKRKDKHNTANSDIYIKEDDRPLDKKIAEALSLKLQHPKPAENINPGLFSLLRYYYAQNGNLPVWSKEGTWNKQSDELLRYLDTCIYEGLFKNDYHYYGLSELKNKLFTDSLKKMKPTDWAKADIGFSAAFMQVLQDLAQGRLYGIKQLWYSDSSKYESFFVKYINQFLKAGNLLVITQSIQPAHLGYINLKIGIKKFTDSMDKTMYTYLRFPYSSKDSLFLLNHLKSALRKVVLFSTTICRIVPLCRKPLKNTRQKNWLSKMVKYLLHW